MRIQKLVGLFALLLLSACGEAEVPQPTGYENIGNFEKAIVEIITDGDTLVIDAELAATEDQRQLGLMERTQLADSAGMLFLYDSTQEATASFWMFRTRIPLDIAFLDSTGRIVAIRNMQPCDSPYAQSCPTYPAGAPFSAALEVNQGYFARHGVDLGDVVRQRTPARR